MSVSKLFLSIIIPVWNDEKYIEECLNSCLDQDLPADDYEIICVDDGSTDRTSEILNRYNELHNNLKVILSRRQGGGKGRVTGFSIAKGDYIWFVDHDDLIRKNCLSEMKTVAVTTSCDRIVFSCYPFHEKFSEEEKKNIVKDTLPCCWDFGDNVVWTSIVKREFLNTNDIFPVTKRLGNLPGWATDTFFIYELKQHGASSVTFSKYPIYYYRLRHNSEDHDVSYDSLMRKVEGYSNMVVLLKKDYESVKLGDYKTRQMVADTMMLMLRKALEALAMLPKSEYKKQVQMLREKQIYPMRIPKEATYTWQECAKEPSGTGALRNIFRFYSVYPIGLFMASLPHRKKRIKKEIIMCLKSHKLTNYLLNLIKQVI